jgi:hypothetical protein
MAEPAPNGIQANGELIFLFAQKRVFFKQRGLGGREDQTITGKNKAPHPHPSGKGVVKGGFAGPEQSRVISAGRADQSLAGPSFPI